jgi:ABC-type dipeptide/oligopeptide/nickel transport system permease subunit
MRGAGLVALIFLALVALSCLFGPSLWPFGYQTTNFDLSSAGPSPMHPLGTDVLGRDLLARLMTGTRASLLIAIFSQVAGVAIGIGLGLLAGTGRRWSDSFVMRGIDIFMAIPDVLLVVLLVPVLSSSLGGAHAPVLLEHLNIVTSGGAGIVLAITTTSWMLPTRLVRSQVLSLRETEFYRAAIVTGASRFRLMAIHLLPHVAPVTVTAFTLGVPRAVLMEGAISYLGLGLMPPMPSLGLLIADGVKVMRSHPTALVFPAFTLCALVVSISLLGDSLANLIDGREVHRL